MAADPRRGSHGGCRRSPHQVPAPWGAGRQPCPRAAPSCPSAHWPGVGGGSRLSPTFPRADGMGSQHRWPCAAADWGRLPATRPGRAASPPRLGDKSEGRERGAEGAAGTAAGPRAAVPAVHGARPGTGTRALLSCKILSRGHSPVMGSLWVSSERGCRVPLLGPKETSQARAVDDLGRVGFPEIALTYAQGSQGTSSRMMAGLSWYEGLSRGVIPHRWRHGARGIRARAAAGK